MLSAKEYFYQFIAPEDGFRNYAAVHHRGLGDAILSRKFTPADFSDLDASALKADYEKLMEGHVPNLSNDVLLETYMRDAIMHTAESLRPRLDKMFVAKLRAFKANAAARHNTQSYDGDLIIFNVGLSDVCFQYATAFTEFVELAEERHKTADKMTHFDLTRRIQNVVNHLAKLASSQERWKRKGASYLSNTLT
jgi:hypothetical protein